MCQVDMDIIAACQLLKNGQVFQSLSLYNQIVKQLTNKIMNKTNCNQLTTIKCTIGVINMSLGNYQISQQNFEDVLQMSISYQIDEIVIIRAKINLIFLQLLSKKYTQALQSFQQICQLIQQHKNTKNILSYVYTLLFRANSLVQLKQTLQPAVIKNLNLMETVSVSSLIRSKDIIEQGLTIQSIFNLQTLCYRKFLSFRRYDFAIAALRHILSLNVRQQLLQQYKQQLIKINMTGLIDEFQLQNNQIVEAMKQIALRLKKIQDYSIFSEINQKYKVIKYAIYYTMLKSTNKHNQSQQDKIIKNVAQQIIKQKNQLLIIQLSKSQFAQTSMQLFRQYLLKTFNYFEQKINQNKRMIFFCFLEKIKKRVQKETVSPRMSNVYNRNKQNKIHGISITTSKQNSKFGIFTSKSQRSSRQIQNIPSLSTLKTINDRKTSKMLKLIEHGTFLNKRNFNSDGGQYRFVKVTNNMIKWGKTPQKVNDGGQYYFLKDVRGIIYGKITPTLNKPQNKLLKSYFCFSLVLQKRTLDFYCKDYQEVQSWVCGLTIALKKINPSIVGYSLGKLRWKKMLLILKANFIDTLPKYERNNYYYQNAYAIIQYGKNKYRLPSKSIY